MNMKKLLDKHPLPWEVERQDMSCDGYYDAVLDCNGSQICLEEIVEVINSEYQWLSTKYPPQTRVGTQDVPRTGQASVVSLLESASYVHFEKPGTSLEMLCTGGGGCIQYRPQLVESVGKEEAVHLEGAEFINSLRGVITINEARTKILGWEPIKGERGDQLLE